MASMTKKQGATGRAVKTPRQKPSTDAVYAAIKMEKPLKTRMEIIAATRGMSFAALSNELLGYGLEEYLKSGAVDISALQSLETTAQQ